MAALLVILGPYKGDLRPTLTIRVEDSIALGNRNLVHLERATDLGGLHDLVGHNLA